jgi:hypothetical protein
MAMRLTNLFLIIIAVGLATFGSSCSIRPKIFLYNNSGQEVAIVSEDENYHVAIGTVVEIYYPKSQTLQINAGEKKWQYRLTYPTKEYMTVGGHEMYFQIDSSGFIYVLLPQQQGPVKDPPTQPKGFPLTPVLTRGETH